MDLSLTDDETTIRDTFASFFGRASTPLDVRAAEPLGFDERLWERAQELGIPALAAPEEHGGGGATLLMLSLIAVEVGRRLAPIPFVESVVALRALGRAGDVFPDVGAANVHPIQTVALRPVAGDRALALVPAGAIASGVIAVDGSDLAYFGATASAHRQVLSNLGSYPLASLDIETGWERLLLASGADAREQASSLLRDWRVLSAATLVGMAEQSLFLGVEYSKDREQFGKPIGSFQAVQHGLADVATAVEGARLLVFKAASATDQALAEADALASMAMLFAGETAVAAAGASLHYHGGYGFMEEYDVQLYYRRAKAAVLLLGDPSEEYQHLASTLWGPIEGPAAQ